MKKRKVGVLGLVLACTLLFGACGQNNTPAPQEPQEPEQTPAEKVDIKIGSLKGPTSLGMLQLMENSEKGETANNYTFDIEGDPSAMAAKSLFLQW